MKEKTQLFEISDGYYTREKRFKADIDSAVRILCSKKHRKITRAVRLDTDTAEIISDVIVCPACGRETPAYSTYKNGYYEAQASGSVRYSKDAIRAWGESQLDIFDEDRTVWLNKKTLPENEFYCPYCSKRSSAASGAKRVWLTEGKNTLRVSCETVDIKGIVALSDVLKMNVSIGDTMTQSVVFNFERGRTYIEVGDKNGILLCRDITEYPEVFKRCRIYSFLSNSKKLWRAVRRVFEEKWEYGSPFESEYTPPEKLMLFTRFIGFSETFYSAIPFESGADTYRLDKSFEAVAAGLHTVKKARELFSTSLIPDCKSVRRIFFEDPELLFYVDECKILWDIIGDVNYYVAMLKTDTIYDLLVFLKTRPVCAEFFRDYAAAKSKGALCSVLKRFNHRVKRTVVDYISMCPEMRKNELERIINDRNAFLFVHDEVNFSTPMAKPNEAIRDCVIDGFKFMWMKNSNDYRKSAKMLKNCLGDWSRERNPVVCVMKNGRYVAAAEIFRDKIVQAWGAENCEIASVEGLEGPFEKWRRRFSLKYATESDFDEVEIFDIPEGELPF